MSSSDSETRRAVTISSFDGADSLAVAEVPVEEPGPADVVVRVAAASIGPWDVYTADGAFAELLADKGHDSFPMVIGWDFAGTVERAGDDADLEPGTRVMGMSPQPMNGIGAHAELVTLPAATCVPVPDDVDDPSAATIPCCALTAKLAVERAHGDGEAKSLLVIGATGQLGGFVTQLAAAAGIEVVASVSADAADAARDLGATHVIDRAGDVGAQVREIYPDGVDAAFDPIGGKVTQAAVAAIRDEGRYVTAVSWSEDFDERGIANEKIFVEEDRDALRELAGMLADGRITARVGEVFPLAEAAKAYAAVKAGGLDGKVVLDATA